MYFITYMATAHLVRRRLTRDETRERILAKADELFRQFGFVKTTVADIAAELGMSPANIYKFFSSKEALFDCLVLIRTPHLYQWEGRELNENRIRGMVRFLGRALK